MFFFDSFKKKSPGTHNAAYAAGKPFAAAEQAALSADADPAPVRYSETVRGYDGVSVYEVYSGPDKASAVAFLRGKCVNKRYYYVVVDTPEGSFGRDITGFYKE